MNLGTNIIKIIKDLGGLKTVLISTLAIFALIKGDSIISLGKTFVMLAHNIQYANSVTIGLQNTFSKTTLGVAKLGLAITALIAIYGELKNAKPLAKRIVKTRETNPIARTEDLVSIVLGKKVQELRSSGVQELDVPAAAKKDMAKVFQALRIEVNDEMGALREMLLAAKDLLKPRGRIAILTYHSLEDRIVKNFLRSGNLEGTIEKDFYGNILTPFKVLEKGLTASAEEVEQNPRARSAKLRVAEKIESNK